MSNVDSQTVNITIPKALLKQVDALAKRDYTSRSDIIRQALLTKIRSPRESQPAYEDIPLDEVDEEGDWKTVIDFREINPNGVPMTEVITALKKLEKRDEQDRKAARKTIPRTA